MAGDPKDIIIGQIQNSVSKMMGSSSSALMRRAGIDASHKIWPELPTGKSIMEAGEIMKEGIKGLGGFGDFGIVSDDGGVAKIEFKGCFFASLTEGSGKPCGQQPICFFGFGLIEETFKRITGIQTKVELVKREDTSETCFEKATPR
ncbi:MAG: hypothetical protein B1H09_04480 [Gemmatimonadaceae bacterium 4484_173]|nr:MAG: hypothetical protein B1H09_04480 [Gemmatimonadaceae bacterium 4484_173]